MVPLMSYDIYLLGAPCSACGHEAEQPELPDPTYNLTRIFHLALTNEPMPSPEVGSMEEVVLGKPVNAPRGLCCLNGARAGDTTERLRAAIRNITNPARYAEFDVLKPSNGWGTLEGATEVLKELLDAAERYPDYVWDIR